MNTIDSITISPKRSGLAGRFTYHVDVSYSWSDGLGSGSSSYPVEFHGSIYGGPIFCGSHHVSYLVTDQIGSTLDPEWIEAFYGLKSK